MKVQYRTQTLDLDDIEDETLASLAQRLAKEIQADVSRISLFIMPKPGLLKHPFPDRHVSEILTPKTRIKLVGTPEVEIKKIEDTEAAARAASSPRSRPPSTVKANKYVDHKRMREESMYTFHAIEPLKWLPNSERSRRFLHRLANDPGIKATMRKRQFSVGLLTEMDPASNTASDTSSVSRLLGLNRNKGEAIELRLRTDAYDGYRSYKVIRDTLCHELTHNVWGDHDQNFWKLCKEIEREVAKYDVTHILTDNEFYNPNDTGEDVVHDAGGWVGGDFVLGGTKGDSGQSGLSRREIIARAAEERARKEKEAREAERQDQS
jgi:hypothetical protein